MKVRPSKLALFSAILFTFTILVPNAYANEAPPAEGGGHGGGGAAEAAKALPEWVEIQSRLQTLKAKVQAKEKTVHELIVAKQKEKNPTESLKIFNELKKEHHELEAVVKEYEQSRNLLRYRYPEKGMKDGRTYKRVEVKPLDEMENQVGMEGQLRQTMNKVRRQYSDTPLPQLTAEQDAKKEAEEKALKERKRKEDGASIMEPTFISK